MGQVYAADDLSLPRRAALKFIAGDYELDPGAMERFITEAKAASSLEHPNICTIYEVGRSEDGHMFIAMPLYEGKTLAAHIRSGPMDIDSAVAYAIEAAGGLARAHDRHIVHRDIKPANLMVTADALKILDFGLAKLTDQVRVTRTGDILGTLDYLSPEMAQGLPTDHRTDIFSLGATLYEMVTGQPPFRAESQSGTFHRIITEAPPSPRSVRKEIPRSLEQVILKSLEKDPDQRYQTMEAFRADLLEILHEVAPSRAVRVESLIRSGRRRRWPVAPLVLGALAVVFVAVGVLSRDRIRNLLNHPGPQESKGVIVLPIRVQSVEPDAPVLAGGMGQEVVDRLVTLSGMVPDLWVVPPRKVQATGITDPEKVGTVYGASTILDGSVTTADGDFVFHLGLLDSGSQERIGQVEIPLAGMESGDVDLDSRLAELLQLKRTSGEGSPRRVRIPRQFLMGLGYMAGSDPARFDSALVAFDEAVSRDSLLVEANLHRADALFRKGEAEKDTALVNRALTAARRAAEEAGPDAGSDVLIGNILSYLGRPGEAIPAFQDGIEGNPRAPDPRRRLGGTYMKLGQFDLAETTYKDAVAANPTYWCAREDLGYFYYVTGKLDEATEQFEQVADAAPDYAPTYNYLGAIAYYQEDWDRAISQFERSFDLDPSYTACSNLGTLYYMTGRFEDAAKMYEWARAYNPTSHVVIGNLAAAYYWTPGGRDTAETIVKDAIALAEAQLLQSPDDALLLSYLAGYYTNVDPGTAERYADRALDLAKDNADVNYRCASVFEMLGNRNRALVLVGDALKNGYSLKVIEHDPYFRKLREDSRFEMLVPDSTSEGSG